MGSRIGFIDLSISHLSVIFLQLGTQIENGVSIRESAVRYINYLWQFSLFSFSFTSFSLFLYLLLSSFLSVALALPLFFYQSLSLSLFVSKNQNYFQYNANFKYIVSIVAVYRIYAISKWNYIKLYYTCLYRFYVVQNKLANNNENDNNKPKSMRFIVCKMELI